MDDNYTKLINDIKILNNKTLNINLDDIKSSPVSTPEPQQLSTLEPAPLSKPKPPSPLSKPPPPAPLSKPEPPAPLSKPELPLSKPPPPVSKPEPPVPLSKPPSPLSKPEPPAPLSKPKPGLPVSKPEPSQLSKPQLSFRRLNVPIGTVILPPKLLTSRFRGGDIVLANIDIDKVINLLNMKNKLAELYKYIYNTYKKLLTMEDILDVLVILKYSEFTDIPIQDITSIPPEFKYNFTDLAKRDINNPELIRINKLNIDNIINLSSLKQSGGKQEDKTVEENINNNIRRLSDYLKKHKKQKGGDPLQDLIGSVAAEIAVPPPAPADQKKKEKELEQKCNRWAQELIGLNAVSKVIRDNEYGIARFYLESDNPNLIVPLDFINKHASILSFNSKAPIKFANPIAPVQTLNNARPEYLSNKLKKYFENRYKNLKLIKDAIYVSIDGKEELPVTYELNTPKVKKPTKEVIDMFRQLLNIQYGGDKIEIRNIDTNKITCIEDCYISSQYKKFERMVVDYFKLHNIEVAKSQIEELNKNINKIQELEEELSNMKEIFNNYKKMQDAFPQKIEGPITFDHIKKLLKDNKFLIDDYGKVNDEAINVVKSIEKYLIVKDELNGLDMTPPRKEVLEDILRYNSITRPLVQAGGNSNITNTFSVFQEQEYFTTDTFKRVLKEIS